MLGYKNKWIGKYLKTGLMVLEFVEGYLLSEFVISSVELIYVKFYHGVILKSYIYGILCAVLLMLVMNVVMYINLKKVNMSRALKNQEQ